MTEKEGRNPKDTTVDEIPTTYGGTVFAVPGIIFRERVTLCFKASDKRPKDKKITTYGLTTEDARKLAAQILTAADLVDAGDA